MDCPQCGAKTRVYETRIKPEGVRRRRVCLKKRCGERLMTLEAVMLPVRKRRGRKPARKRGRG